MPRHAHFTITAALGVAASLLAGCGDGDSADPVTLLLMAGEKSAAAGTFRMHVTHSVTDGRQVLALTSDGEYDLVHDRAWIKMDMSAVLGAFGYGVEGVFDGPIRYMKFPEGLGPGDKPWLRLDVAAMRDVFGAGYDQGMITLDDPREILSILHGVAADARRLGSETVRGASTTHYQATLDLESAAARAGGRTAALLRDIVDEVGRSAVPGEYWLDAAGAVRRVQVNLDVDGPGPKPPAPMIFELYDLGAPIEVALPPAADVQDYWSLPPSRRPR